LCARGFGQSEVTVLENMGGPREQRFSFMAEAPPERSYSDLNTLAIRCVAAPGAKVLSRLAGLPDDAFQHDGQMTKREQRAVTLAALSPAPDQLLWDVGAGCGSVAIEWMRAARGCEAIAFETSPERRAMMAANADALGTPRLRIVAGEAPASLAGQAPPDAAFIGGGLGEPGLFEAVWAALKPGGRLVANTVTVDGEIALFALQEKHGGEVVRMEVSQLGQVGRLRAMKPRMAVTQWRTVKPW
jgi:precorrin-6Y C5,15-methyltransferase (decarboxylating)